MGLTASLALGLSFVAFNFINISLLPFAAQTNAYGSLFHVISVFLNVVALVGAALIAAALIRIPCEHWDRQGFMALQMQMTSMFWYFVVVAGVIVFATLYLSPYVL